MKDLDFGITGIGTTEFLIIGSALGVFVAVLALAFATTKDSVLATRIRAVTGVRTPKPAETNQTSAGQTVFLPLMRRVVNRFKLLRSNGAKDIAAKLAQAGWRSKDALVIYLFSRLCLPFLTAGTAVFALYGLEMFGLSPMLRFIGVLGGFAAGLLAPSVFVRNMGERRRSSIRKALPDALDLMVICTEAGLSLDATLVRVAKEIGPTSSELAEEIALTSSELSLLSDRKQALDNLRRRIDLPPVNALCTTLLQTEKFGTPLAQALRVLAGELRNERMLRAEEKAARLPAIMTVPLIVFILPALFVVVLGPAVVSIIDAFAKM